MNEFIRDELIRIMAECGYQADDLNLSNALGNMMMGFTSALENTKIVVTVIDTFVLVGNPAMQNLICLDTPGTDLEKELKESVERIRASFLLRENGSLGLFN